jgi:quercetin dioxygenase-like cupin family protein
VILARAIAAMAVAGALWPAAPFAAQEPAQEKVQPVALGPERTSVLDNGTVGVTRLRFARTAREAVHTHPFPVLIVLVTPGQVSVADREMLRVGSRAGEVWFIPANTPHAAANQSTGHVEMLKVAIKTDRPRAPAAPLTQAPDGITRSTLLDNADVRVVRVRFAPDSREPLHTHPNDLLTIQISAGNVDILNGAEHATRVREPGFVQFLPRNVQHAFASTDTKPFELLSVSIK